MGQGPHDSSQGQAAISPRPGVVTDLEGRTCVGVERGGAVLRCEARGSGGALPDRLTHRLDRADALLPQAIKPALALRQLLGGRGGIHAEAAR